MASDSPWITKMLVRLIASSRSQMRRLCELLHPVPARFVQQQQAPLDREGAPPELNSA